MLNHMETGPVVALISLNISAAFDMVNQNEFSGRVRHLRKVIEWIYSDQQEMRFYVRVGSSSLAVISSASSVPRGSVLGPIMFMAYVSPIGVIDILVVSCRRRVIDSLEV